MRVSNSEISTFKRCRRKWYGLFYRRLRLKRESPVGAPYLGTLVHGGLRAYYEDKIPWTDWLDARIAAQLEDYPDEEKGIVDQAELASLMLEGYFDWLEETGADAEYTLIGAERTLDVPFTRAISIPLDEELVISGKLDRVIERRTDGARLYVDDKTVGSLNDLPKNAQRAEQFLMYDLLQYVLALESGEEFQRTDGGIYNMLRKVKRTVRAKPPFYGRHEVRHNVQELRSFWIRLVGEIEEIVRLRQRLDAGADHRHVAYPTPTRDCSWDCPLVHICTMFDDGSDVERAIEQLYEEYDPYERYEETEPPHVD